MTRRLTPRPLLFDVLAIVLTVALLVTAAVLVTDLMCRYNDQPNGCNWPWGNDETRYMESNPATRR